MNMNLTISSAEKELLITALNVLQDEYMALSRQANSKYFSLGFEQDANRAVALLDRVRMLHETLSKEQLDSQVLSLMKGGLKINAIKLVRENTRMCLKDAKDYAEELNRNQVL